MIDNAFNKRQYTKHAGTYLDSNKTGAIGGGSPHTRAQMLSQYLPTGRTVFEIGSGGGDDAQALKDTGYDVWASDFVEEFVSKLQDKGLKAQLFDAKKDEFPTMDALYANAVFVHFTPHELRDCLLRAKQKLTHEKLLFMSVIKGEGQERSGRARGIERDFQYYTLELLTSILKDSGFSVVHSEEVEEKWLWVVCTLNNEMDVDVFIKDV